MIMRCVVAACAWLATATSSFSQDIEPMRAVFEARAVRVTVVVPSECDEALDDSCNPSGSAVILGATESTVFIATAAHVLDPLYSAGPPALDDLTLDWLTVPTTCASTLQPMAIWRPAPIAGPADDVAFIVAGTRCASPMPMVANAWRDGELSYGVTMHFVELYSPFGSRRLSAPIYLSDACIPAQSCFNDGLVQLQGRIEGKTSGSAVFSAAGLVGVAITTDGLIAAPRIDEALRACATGACDAHGEDVDLAPWAERFAESLLPPKPYAEVGYLDDVSLVTTFLDALPPHELNRAPESGCAIDERTTRTRIAIEEGVVTVSTHETNDRSDCVQLPDLLGIGVTTCAAPIDAIDPTIELWSGPSMRLNCARGTCFSCSYHYDAELQGHEDVRERRSFDAGYSHFSVSSRSYFFADAFSPIREREQALYRFGRAFARIVSGGDHSAFCLMNSIDC